MRRTYRSKKDYGGGLDHRDVLLSMDDKSSAFDAFYIQNIKQTKRELSCVSSLNHFNVAPGKVRKRKFVKRLVKEVSPPPRESLSESVFLTPDKSIRVNKAPDLFDQLLESSPTWKIETKPVVKDKVFENVQMKKQSKTYTRKRSQPKKKINYSSSDSCESDNHGNNENISKNVTDIRAHELIVEKEKTPRPQYDESIDKIVKNLSLLQNFCLKTPGSSKKMSKISTRNRLTNNCNSPLIKASPLSSTPFLDKTRCKSIYKFSPIPMSFGDESPNYVTIMGEDEPNESIILVPKSSSQSKLYTDKKSPETHGSYNNVVTSKRHSKPLFTSDDASSKSSVMKEVIASDENSIKMYEVEPNTNFSGEVTHNKTEIEDEVVEQLNNSIILPEVEPDTNFSEEVTHNKTEIEDEVVEQLNNSIILPITKLSKGKQKSKTSFSSIPIDMTKTNNEISSIDYSGPVKPFLGFTNVNVSNISNILQQNSNVDASYNSTDSIYSENNVEEHNTLDDSNGEVIDTKETTNNNKPDSLSEDNYTDDDISGSEEEECTERASLYDTCNSEQVSTQDESLDEVIDKDGNIHVIKKPTVNIERINESLLDKYLVKNTEDSKSSFSDESDWKESDNDYTSFDNKEDLDSDDSQSDTDIAQSTCKFYDSLISHTDGETTQVEEERCISFVTTRRRNEVNNSTMFVLNESLDSSTSTECDKTVLSNNVDISAHKTEIIEENKDSTLIQTDDETNKDLHTGNKNSTFSQTDDETNKDLHTGNKSETTMANEIELSVDEFVNCSRDTVEVKPSIVLQPGKKWERSLSIYRRMTMLNDPVNHSILDEEDLQSKGRKYRQSVMDTMEMQDKGTLHNESIHSRRSTFVCKPSRSTIRIVKETNSSRLSLSSTTVVDDLKGFLEDCDDTIVELSKLSLSDSHEVTVLEKFHEPSRVTSARDYVLRRCSQTEAILFDECYPDTVLKNCRKIGEGVYGEVFLWRATDGRARVMKIVPVAGSVRVNGEHQKDFSEIISEIVIAMELSALRAPIAEIERHFDDGHDTDALDLHSVENATDIFNEVLAVRLVYGSYPSRLLDLWELFDETKGSENDNPAVLPAEQQFIVLELANAGQDLESYQFNNAEQAYSLFLQVAFGLAVGEEAYQFEHRDLHWGNVLIQPTDQKYATFVLRGRSHRVLRRGVSATIIDYSLSRLQLPLGVGAAAAALYNDLAGDEGLFGAVGDYQFEVYRLMRDKLGNDWKNFEPYTNILWLHYTVDKMITALRYKRTNTKTHKQYIAKLKSIKDRILSYGSAAQFVLTDNEY